MSVLQQAKRWACQSVYCVIADVWVALNGVTSVAVTLFPPASSVLVSTWADRMLLPPPTTSKFARLPRAAS